MTSAPSGKRDRFRLITSAACTVRQRLRPSWRSALIAADNAVYKWVPCAAAFGLVYLIGFGPASFSGYDDEVGFVVIHDSEFGSNLWWLVILFGIAFVFYLAGEIRKEISEGGAPATDVLATWAGGLARVATTLGVVFTSSATAAWYQGQLLNPSAAPLQGINAHDPESLLATQYFLITLLTGSLAIGIELRKRSHADVAVRGAPVKRWRSRVVVVSAVVLALGAREAMANVEKTGVDVPFGGTLTFVATAGLLLALSPGAALRRMGAGALAFSVGILSAAWGFLYGLGYETRSMTVVSHGVRKDVAPHLSLKHEQAKRLGEVVTHYASGAILLLLATGLVIYHHHQRRLECASATHGADGATVTLGQRWVSRG